MVLAYALTPRDLATSIRAEGITDGPFIDAKEIVAGFYILEAPDLDTALRTARRNPAIAAGGGVEQQERVAGPALLERAGALQEVELAEDLGADELGERHARRAGRAVDAGADPVVGSADVGEREAHVSLFGR